MDRRGESEDLNFRSAQGAEAFNDLKGHTAVVTGGSRGIGEAIVRAFIDHGCHVIINHRRATGKGAAQVKRMIEYAEKKGIRAGSFLADISNRKEVNRMFEKIGAEFGAEIDHLILNAGATPFKFFQHLGAKDWRQLLETNLVGNVDMVQNVLPFMEKRGGTITFLSSTGSRMVLPKYPMGIMKAAMEHLVRYLDFELNPKAIRVNGICAGLTKTDTIDRLEKVWGPVFELTKHKNRDTVLMPEEVADIVIFLSSKKSFAIQGAVVLADKGATL